MAHQDELSEKVTDSPADESSQEFSECATPDSLGGQTLNNENLEFALKSSIEDGKLNDPCDHDAFADQYPEGGLGAWLVVLGSFSAMMGCFGFTSSCGIFQAYISTHQLADYDESTVGWIFSVYIFLAFVGGVFLGPFFDAKGPRLLVASGSVSLVAGIFAMAEATEYWHFMLTFGIICGLGTSLIFTPSVACIAHYFCRRRGFATGLAATGGSLGGVLYPLVLPTLFDQLGFTWATRIVGFTFIAFFSVANVLLRARLPPIPNPGMEAFMPDFRIFLKGRGAFAVTVLGVFAIEWGFFIPISYLTSWALHAHVGDMVFGYHLLAILNAGSFFGRWLPGVCADRFGRFNVMVAACATTVLALLGLWLPASVPGTLEGPTTSATGYALAVCFALLFGFGSGSVIGLTPVCVGQLCPVADYGRYYATCYTVVSLGCLTGLPIAGELLAACGGEYTGLVLFTAASYVVGAAAFAAARVLQVGWRLRAIC